MTALLPEVIAPTILALSALPPFWQQPISRLDHATQESPEPKTANLRISSAVGNMKLRPRVKVPTDNSNTMTATLPVLPPNMLRLQTPPISEVSNAGSTVARKNRLSELSSSIMSISDPEETIDSVSPTKNRDRPKITVPAAPLTKRNLAKYQEEMTSAVEMASEHEHSPPPPTPNTRLTQARNYLMNEGIISDPEFESRGLQIAEYLYSHGHGKEKYEMQLRKEVVQLLKHHDFHAAGSSEQPPQHWPSMTRSEASTPVMSLSAEDDQDPEEQADPFEWNNKLDDLTDRVKKRPSGGKEAFAFSELRELARPLNGGRLPSLGKAQRLINEQMVRENHENRSSNQTDDDRLWAFEKYRPPTSKEKKFSLDRWSGHPPEGSRAATLKLGEGNFMPQEMMDIDWDRDRAKLEESLVGYDDVDRGEAQLLLAETPLLQALMSEQIERDLARST